MVGGAVSWISVVGMRISTLYVYVNPIDLCDPYGLLFFGGFFGKFGMGSMTFLAPSGLARQRYS
jgi:hypothetical protein